MSVAPVTETREAAILKFPVRKAPSRPVELLPEGTRTVSSGRDDRGEETVIITVVARVSEIDQIASWWPEDREPPVFVRAIACPEFGEVQAEGAWRAHQEAVRRRDEYKAGGCGWLGDFDLDDMPPGEQTEVAQQLACEEADRTRAWLISGRAGR